MESELSLSIGGLPPLSARGCTQQLIPINHGEFHRNLNGELIFLGEEEPKKFKSIIDCEDKTPLATDGLHRGCEILVGCIQRLWQKVKPGVQKIVLEKIPVLGSVQALDYEKNTVKILAINGQTVEIENTSKEVFISYRPLLNMRTVAYSLSTNEWGIKVGWHLELEEI